MPSLDPSLLDATGTRREGPKRPPLPGEGR